MAQPTMEMKDKTESAVDEDDEEEGESRIVTSIAKLVKCEHEHEIVFGGCCVSEPTVDGIISEQPSELHAAAEKSHHTHCASAGYCLEDALALLRGRARRSDGCGDALVSADRRPLAVAGVTVINTPSPLESICTEPLRSTLS